MACMFNKKPIALIPCPACALQVSTRARACRRCGHPLQDAPFPLSSATVAGTIIGGLALASFLETYDSEPQNIVGLSVTLAGIAVGLILATLGGIITLLRQIRSGH